MKFRYYKILFTNIHTLDMNVKIVIDLELQKNTIFTIYFVKILTISFKLLNLCSTFFPVLITYEKSCYKCSRFLRNHFLLSFIEKN